MIWKKQIAEAKKKKEDPEELQQQVAMLKKQVKMMSGVTKGIITVSDKTFQQAAKNDNISGILKRDVDRIKQLPNKILTDVELVSYVKKIHSEVERILNEKDKAEAIKTYSALKSEKKSSNDINTIASNLWLAGYPEIALYIMGKECAANIKDANTLNNYAAFLTMKGGEHAALPILQNLNRNFPDNSTILNNIGQAWFGLGDMNNANRYLDSTTMIYKNHSQANVTKSNIQKSEGKIDESIESLRRSLAENYTPRKRSPFKGTGIQGEV